MQRYNAGTSVCHQCGFTLTRHGKTKTQTMSMFVKAIEMPRIRGTAVVSSATKLSLMIDRECVTIPIAEKMIVGRWSEAASDEQPDINLEHFSAIQHGVSRRHLMIEWKGVHAYITDMDSKNGTWLNGTKLSPYTEQMLCNNDELQLGDLKIIVCFQ
jgi:hypothetical protein